MSRRTPQGVRGLKPNDIANKEYVDGSHSARSAWIETIKFYGIRLKYGVALRKECVD